MRIIFLLGLFLLSGCQTAGTILQGAGDGLSKASHEPTQRQMHCTADHYGGADCQ